FSGGVDGSPKSIIDSPVWFCELPPAAETNLVIKLCVFFSESVEGLSLFCLHGEGVASLCSEVVLSVFLVTRLRGRDCLDSSDEVIHLALTLLFGFPSPSLCSMKSNASLI